MGLPCGSRGKEPTCHAGDMRDPGSIPGSGRSPEGEHNNPFQYSCLENPMDREAWQATVHRAAESDTLKQETSHTGTHALNPISVFFKGKVIPKRTLWGFWAQKTLCPLFLVCWKQTPIS